MPVITAEVLSLTKNQKEQLVKKYTETTSKITGISKDRIIVLLKENNMENVGVNGVLLSDK